METTTLSFIVLLVKTCACMNVTSIFENINLDIVKYNAIAAEIAWTAAVDPADLKLAERSYKYQKNRLLWQQRTCDKLAILHNGRLLNSAQERQHYLLCRGPKFTFDEARKLSSLYDELQSIYSDARICIPYKNISKDNFKEIEAAILDYLSAVKEMSEARNDSMVFAAKVAARDVTDNEIFCLHGETDLDGLMSVSKNEEVLKFLWLAWREKVGPPMKKPYRKLIVIENRAAQRNGYKDIGAAWRDELELPNLKHFCRQLYAEFRPLYSLLHGVVRFFLRRQYGDTVPERGAIPAHLLGSLWSHNWESLLDLIVPNTLDLDQSIKRLNWTVPYMVRRAEDFYLSLGLPAMTDKFWRESVFSRENHNATRCHGAAANMFKNGDYRLLYCSGTSLKDFYVIHHEMGHIQYYMAYENQSGIFREGANSAFHESIGDTIMLGVMTPQHLHRLGLINDTILYAPISSGGDDTVGQENKNIENLYKTTDEHKHTETGSQEKHTKNNLKEPSNDETEANVDTESVGGVLQARTGQQNLDNINVSLDDFFILKQALNKLPQIPFSLVIDEYRWKYFEGGVLNRDYWSMVRELQGIAPPEVRGEQYFDAGAMFHVPDNTPYIRYFLSSFLQHQLFESVCKAAVFGQRDVQDPLPDTITMNRCDIYGSRTAGKLLKDLMSRGSSQPWREVLVAATGSTDISASALKRYYRPLHELLIKIVQKYRIPVGW